MPARTTIKYASLGLTALLLSSCIGEDYFGLSPYGNIKSLEVQNQASTSRINIDSMTVTIELPPGIDASKTEIHRLSLSSFATADKAPGDMLDLSGREKIEVTAEDGSLHSWTIIPEVAGVEPQLQYGDMNTWYETRGGFYEPGEDASSTIWGTGNAGTQILGKLATIPREIENGNFLAHLETLDNGSIAGAFGAPISAGSLFTGYFDADKIDPSDPEAAIDFGQPFIGRPRALRFTYTYVPGPENKDKNGNLLDEKDKCDIYALLELRSGGGTQRLATAWFRSDENMEELSTIEIDFIYGKLGEEAPDYMKPEDGAYVSPDSSSFILPSHITFVATSSYLGAEFSGAIGSTLWIDDIEMVYETREE